MKTIQSTNKTTILFVLLSLAACWQVKAGSLSKPGKSIIGLWQTTLSQNGSEAILIFEFKSTETDSLQCLLSFPESGMNDIPYGKFLIVDDSIHLPNFDACIKKGKKSFHGLFTGAGVSIEIKFVRIDQKPVFEFSIPNKEPAWQLRTKDAIWSSPVVYNDYLIFGNDAGEVMMVKLEDQSLVWTFNCNGKVRSKALVDESNIFLSSDDGYLYNIDFATGSLIWKTAIGNDVTPRSDPSAEGSSYDYLCSSPTMEDGIIFVGSKDSCLYAVDSERGEILWKYKTGDMIRSTPLVKDGIVYVGSWDHYMYAIDAKTSDLIWKFDAFWSIQSSPVIYENKLIFGSRGTFVFAVDTKTGNEVWKIPYWSSWVESSPVIYDGIVYISAVQI